jgi:KaiC/GvpD/RAD55 family RecA-like ATPase
MDIEKKLNKKDILLVKVSSDEYNDTVLEAVEKLSNKKLCYVTLNKTYKSLEEKFGDSKANMDNIYFIDAISGTIKKTSNKEHVYFAPSPNSLTKISLAITKFLERDFDYLIFDSITNLLTYHDKSSSERFINSIINKIKDSGTKAIFYALQTQEQKDLINKCSTFVDETIDVGG